MRRLQIWLVIVVVLVATAWGVLWWLVSAYVDRAVSAALAASAEGEVAIACEERRQRGFPFRFEVVCSGLTAQATDGAWSARLAGLRAGAMVRSPREIEAHLESPLAVTAAALERPATAEWASSRAAIFVGEDGPRSLSARLFSATAEIGGARLMAHQGRLSVTQHEEGGSRVAGATEQLRLTVGEQALPPFDLSAEARTPIPPEVLLSGDIDRSGGLSVRDLFLSVEMAQVQAFADGDIEVDPEGWVSGGLTLHFVGVERLPALLDGLPEGVGGGANVAVGALMALAAPAEWRGRPARRIVLTIEDGEVRAGPLSLGRLPPLWNSPASS